MEECRGDGDTGVEGGERGGGGRGEPKRTVLVNVSVAGSYCMQII